ncbi:MAG: aminoglycoside phosphotransferase family protein [Alphaproteobacteria bacterium]|nr:aminoglycoside phosphotransferase family protein [Alphaproteobacteria bacterium]
MDADNTRLEITCDLARALVADQFPLVAPLPLKPVSSQGWDNATFRLGDELSVRIPTAKCYAAQPLKEQEWLPFLSPHLTVQIPQQIALGLPSARIAWHWSLCTWREGAPLLDTDLSQESRKNLALDLAHFIKELHQIEAKDGPPAGLHNFWRGGSLLHYDTDVKDALMVLTLPYSRKTMLAIWEDALSSSWEHPPCWVHGDVSVGNLLLQDGRLSAVIDFGCMGVGDPACDLVMAWTYFKGAETHLFQHALPLDRKTWSRAKGWALWKALITLQAHEKGARLPGMSPYDTLERLIK